MKKRRSQIGPRIINNKQGLSLKSLSRNLYITVGYRDPEPEEAGR